MSATQLVVVTTRVGNSIRLGSQLHSTVDSFCTRRSAKVGNTLNKTLKALINFARDCWEQNRDETRFVRTTDALVGSLTVVSQPLHQQQHSRCKLGVPQFMNGNSNEMLPSFHSYGARDAKKLLYLAVVAGRCGILQRAYEKSELLMSSVDKNHDRLRAAPLCLQVGFYKQRSRMRVLPTHDENCNRQRRDRTNSLHPGRPVSPRKIQLQSSDNHGRDGQETEQKKNFTARHKTFKSFHEGIIA